MKWIIEFEEADGHLIMLALAELALSRPGWDWTLSKIAERCGGKEVFERFKETSADRVKHTHLPLGFYNELAKYAEKDPPQPLNRAINL